MTKIGDDDRCVEERYVRRMRKGCQMDEDRCVEGTTLPTGDGCVLPERSLAVDEWIPAPDENKGVRWIITA